MLSRTRSRSAHFSSKLGFYTSATKECSSLRFWLGHTLSRRRARVCACCYWGTFGRDRDGLVGSDTSEWCLSSASHMSAQLSFTGRHLCCQLPGLLAGPLAWSLTARDSTQRAESAQQHRGASSRGSRRLGAPVA